MHIHNIRLLKEKGKYENFISDAIKNGIKHQNKILKTYKNSKNEMTGKYIQDNICIYFCNDMIHMNKLYEIKNIFYPPKNNNYLNKSLLQVAFYKSMIVKGANNLSTASFKIKKGFKKEYLTINNKSPYYLLFGDKKYQINVLNSKEIINFYIKKAKATLNIKTAKDFDNKYNKKEFEIMSNYFKYKKI